MPKLEVTGLWLRALVGEVAPAMERLTDWGLHIEEMAVRVVSTFTGPPARAGPPRAGRIIARPVLGGLHHENEWLAA